MKATASGVLLLHRESGRLLLLRRRPDADAGGTWAYPGGKIDPGETPEEAAMRELREETGLRLSGPLRSIGVARNGFETFVTFVDKMPNPELNEEHSDWVWARFSALPAPLHPVMVDHLLQTFNPLAWVRRVATKLATQP